jgi:hypothetical protein
MISIERNDTKSIPAFLGKAAVLASAVVLVAVVAVTSAHASANSCGRALGKCESACSKRSIGKDVCYKKCERAFMNCD